VNEALARPFEMEELLVAVKAMKYCKAPGNNGLIWSHYWGISKVETIVSLGYP